MRREIFFLDDPDRHVDFRWDAIQRLTGPRLAGQSNTARHLDLYREQLLLTIAGYSRGDALDKLQPWFSKAIAFLGPYRDAGGKDLDLRDPVTYHQSLWTLSLGLLFGLEADALKQLVRNLGIAGQDALCDRLIKVALPDLQATETVLFPAPYQHLLAAIDADAAGVEAHLTQFLAVYYDQQAQLPWFDSHVKQSPRFFGYWSFELAALVKAFHWSDHSFADNIFYPRDFVHQRMFRTWLDGAEGDKDRSEMDSALEDEDLQASVEFLGQYFKQHFGSKTDDMPEALDVLSKLSSVSNSQMQENPELMQTVIVQIMRSVLSASSGLNKVLDAEGKAGKNSPEMEAFIASIKAKEKEWQGTEIDAEALLSELPPEARAELEGKVGKVPSEQLKEHYGKISDRLSEVLETEQVDQLTFLEGLERMASDFGFALGKDPRPIAQEVADKVTAELRKQREGRNLDNYDWSQLFEKKDGDA